MGRVNELARLERLGLEWQELKGQVWVSVVEGQFELWNRALELASTSEVILDWALETVEKSDEQVPAWYRLQAFGVVMKVLAWQEQETEGLFFNEDVCIRVAALLAGSQKDNGLSSALLFGVLLKSQRSVVGEGEQYQRYVQMAVDRGFGDVV